MKNPLLFPFVLPPFSKIQADHVLPAITKALNDGRAEIENIVAKKTPYTWESLCQPLAEIDNTLERIVSPICHLNSVKSSPEFRETHKKVLALLSEYNTWVSQHKGLYHAYLNLRESLYYELLSVAQKKTIDNVIRDFNLSGINLPKNKQVRYSEIIGRLSELSNQYNNNVFDSTVGWEKIITDVTELDGVPDTILALAKSDAEAKNQKGCWVLTLAESSYYPVMTYCNNQALRKEMYIAYNTRASDVGPNSGKWDNGPVMEEILSLRHELAQLLGFKTYAHKSLATKMVKSPKQVLDFLTNLVKIFRPKGEKEFAKLFTFARTEFGINKLHPWDIAYYSEKQKQQLYQISNEQLRPYFCEHRVMHGLFEIVKRVYGITVKERKNVDVWDPDVHFFELYNEENELCGSFYLDLYSRKTKRSGAWMDNCASKMRKANGLLQKPVAYLTCNFPRPIDGNPALLTHDEVITLFHEFGHGLHHMLTRIEIAAVSGINGVPWDAVELPSQFMENWCWEKDVLRLLSGHFKTEKPLPRKLLNKILAMKNYQAGMFLLRQLELGLFDIHLHSRLSSSEGEKTLLNTFFKIQKQVSVIPKPSWDRFPHVFSHIFSGGYEAGYYGYLWAAVLAADAYSRFEEEGIFNRETGQSFLENVLSRGGSEEPMELFKRFRGREPKLDAMLKYYGVKRSFKHASLSENNKEE